jgi:hypothetical protein
VAATRPTKIAVKPFDARTARNHVVHRHSSLRHDRRRFRRPRYPNRNYSICSCNHIFL